MASLQQKGSPQRQGKNFSISNLQVLLSLVALRLANALTIRTFFQPDEYFQALEPAWRMAFGTDSGAWITWEWELGLRSHIHPLLFGAAYRVSAAIASTLPTSASSRAELLIAVPKVVQAFLAASSDFYTWKLSERIYGVHTNAALVTLLLSMSSPWNWFCSTRTLSNSLETCLTVAALKYWPWEWSVSSDRVVTYGSVGNTRSLRTGLILAAIACILRPTNGLIWLVLYAQSLYQLLRCDAWSKFIHFHRQIIVCGTSVITISSLIERYFFGAWTQPGLKFIYLNVVQSISDFYGENRPDYYLTEGLPLLLTTALPFAGKGISDAMLTFRSRPSGERETAGHTLLFGNTSRSLASICLFTIAAFSLLSHKEARFIYPLLPALLVLATGPVLQFFLYPSGHLRRKPLLATLLILNLIIAAYTSQVHQSGVLDVLSYLRHEHEQKLSNDSMSTTTTTTTAAFLMPCHSTPWRSHLVHPTIHAFALTCEPPLHLPRGPLRDAYMDEADLFYEDPSGWLTQHMEDTNTVATYASTAARDAAGLGRAKVMGKGSVQPRAWPEYVVFFQQLEPLMREHLKGTVYGECWRAFNSHVHDDWRRKGDVIVWCRKDQSLSSLPV